VPPVRDARDGDGQVELLESPTGLGCGDDVLADEAPSQTPRDLHLLRGTTSDRGGIVGQQLEHVDGRGDAGHGRGAQGHSVGHCADEPAVLGVHRRTGHARPDADTVDLG
jgi:hypothetical protein